MKVAVQICEDRIATKLLDLFPDEYIDDGITSILTDMAPDFGNTFVGCKIIDKWTDCKDWLFPVITDKGLCHTFNSLNRQESFTNATALDLMNLTSKQPPSDWNPDSGYADRKTSEMHLDYPRHTYFSGLQSSFSAVLREHQKNIDPLCGGGVQGYRVYIHAPNERPLVLKTQYEIALEKSILLTVEPKVVEIPDEIRKFGPKVRRCYLSSERKLLFYKHYTEPNCNSECLANFTLTQCGCVSFSMPSMPHNFLIQAAF